MSLVREALARAEREAAARAAREKGLPPALSDAAQPYRARRRSRAPWLGALAVAALVGAGVAAVLVRAGAARPTEPAAPASETQAASEAPPATATPAPPPPAAPAAAVDLPAASATDTAPSPLPPAVPAPAALASAPAGRIPAAAKPSAAAVVTPELAGSFVREYALGDGRAIRLGGIAWSDAAPLAFLNGRLRGVGEVVEGWRIAAIERDRVLLEAGRLRVVLALR